ncbi:MAG TPA: prolyl oligopeptidase family serine peptidase [Labilithrix sp.]|nr:prolyl oligopeptidase family serine peptidase [Labilithrix sp.]
MRVEKLDGESTILPRIARSPGGSTRTTPRSIDVAGTKRGYLLVEPIELDAAKSHPLVLVFHGDGGDAHGFHRAWPFERATGHHAVLAYLDGILARWDLETTKDNRDVAFVEAVVDAIAKERPIDRARVFATGYSSGGFLANVVACQRPGLLRAIASNAGGAPYNQREKWPNGSPKCPGQEPVATLALHGERDFTVTLDSGRYTAEYWAYVNGCRTDEMETTGYPECRLYRGCPTGKAVGFCSVPPLGHWVWDEAAEASWTFFERQ